MKQRKAFTLVELLIAIGIVCIVAAVSVPILSGLLSKSNEQSDEVSAGLYTSVMQQFANEKAGEAVLYPGLTTTGADAEYAVLSQKAGQGMFPGYNILTLDNNEDIYDAIRREAVIAIKAFTDIKTKDGYYVSPPSKEHFQYVYYYLTGQVAIEDERTKSSVTKSSIENGVINVEDFWVYLSRDGGSGDAISNAVNGTGMVFVQLRQFGTDRLLDDVTVTLRIGSEIRTAVTGLNGTVGFTDVSLGSVFIEAEKLGAVSFPNSEFYDETGHITVKEGGYIGDSAANPYVITLKMGSLGSIGFYRRTNTWTGTQWSSNDVYITEDVDFTSAFRVNTSRDVGIARNETYYTNAETSAGRQVLLTADGKFLLYGPYKLTVSASGFRDYREDVVSRVYGIDNYKNGGLGEYADASEPYEYPVVMRRPEGKGEVSGIITWERAEQPLASAPSFSGTWVTGAENYAVNTRVVMKNSSTGTTYYSGYFSSNTSGKYSYKISNLPDGTYQIYLESQYGSKNYFDLSGFPASVTVDGAELVINASAKYSDVDVGSAKITVTYDERGNNDPISGAAVRLKRLGSTDYGSKTSSDVGQVSFSNTKRGFYQIKITLPSYIGNSEYTYKTFIDGDEDIVIRLPIEAITVSGTVTGYKPDGNPMSIAGSFSGLTLKFTRYNEAGTKSYSTVNATVATSGVQATYEISVVPGMYKLSTAVTCYKGYANASALNNFKANKTFNFSLEIDGNNITCHPNESIVWEQNASYHWQKCSKCETIFNKNAHTPSAWTASGGAGCYRYCTEANCKRTLDPVTAHDYKYQSSGSYAATCVKKGNSHYECSRCSYGKDVPIDYTGHNFGAWTSDNSETHSRSCRNSGCSEKETQAHSFNDWYWSSTTVTMSDDGGFCYYNGTKRADCLTCGYYKTNSPKVGHSIECYIMREYMSSTRYYNFPTNISEAFFVSSTGRVYMKLGSSRNYSGRQVWGPNGASSGAYGMSYFLSSRISANYNKSAIFSNTGYSHYTACGNRPVINGVPFYCHAPVNHEGNPLRTTNQCGCANKPLGYIRLQNGTEILPKTNPAWEDPYKRAGRR